MAKENFIVTKETAVNKNNKEYKYLQLAVISPSTGNIVKFTRAFPSELEWEMLDMILNQEDKK